MCTFYVRGRWGCVPHSTPSHWPAWTSKSRDTQLSALGADPTAFSHRTELTTESPLWVGAWWVGFLGAGAAALFIAVPILGYPRRLPGGCSPSLPPPLSLPHECASPLSCELLRFTGSPDAVSARSSVLQAAGQLAPSP